MDVEPGSAKARRILAGPAAVLLLVSLACAGACRKYVTNPITRRPVITSVVAFPTVLGPGDSTMITIQATDPDGDPLVYDWEPYNGLVRKGSTGQYDNTIYHTPSASMIFYRSPTWTYPYDTAFVFCSATDAKGGYATRQVLIYYRN